MPAPATFSKSISGFDPRSVSGCQLWLDAADSSSVTGTTTVTAWRDKSNNSRNLSVGSGTTSYANNAITLASSYMLFTGAVDLTNFTFFIVAKSNGAIYNQTVFGARPNTSAVYNSTDGFGFYMDNQNSIRLYGTLASGATLVSFSATTSVAIVYSFQSDSTIINGFRNGTSVTGASGLAARTSTAQGFALGAEWNGTTYINIISTASINEIIVYNTNLSTSQRQAIEGYLAWKWGIEITPSLPTSVPGLAMWLDGADLSTLFTDTSATTRVTADGNSIAAWRDKSTNAYLFTQATLGSRPIYKTSILNGQSITRWNGTSTVLQSSATLPFYTSSTSGGSFFVVFMATTVASQRFLMTYQNQTANTYCGTESELGYTTGNGGQGNFGLHQGCSRATVAATGTIVINSYVLMSYILGTTGTTPANSTIFKNGVSLTPANDQTGFYSAGSYPSANNARFLNIGARIFNGTNPTDCWHSGDIAELIWYRTPLSTTERQGVESYLSSKWNISVPTQALPLSHPFSSIRPFSRGFQPIDISIPEYWFDAADSNTITTSGSFLTTWLNKGSFTGSNVTPTTANTSTSGTTRVNGNNLINIPITQRLQFTGTFPNLARARFIVTRQTSAGDVTYMFQGGAATTGYDYLGISANTLIEVAQGQIVNLQTATIPAQTNLMSLLTFFNSSVATGSNRIALNGSNVTLTTSIIANQYFAGSITTFLSHTGGPGQDLGEFISFNQNLTSQQIFQIEGYLAWKWGLQSSLPATHPYNKFPPSSAIPFLPINLSGCALWLDGADLSSINLSGSNVTQWNDKSGNGRNLPAVSGFSNATISSAFQNGLSVLNFSGNGLYRTAADSTVYPQDVYVIVALKSLTTHVDVLGMGPTNVDNFNSLTFSEGIQSRWQNGSSGGVRNVFSPTNETSTGFLLIQWSLANNNYLLRRNGTQLVQSSSFTYTLPSGSVLQIGFRHTNLNQANFSGYIGEIIVFNSQLANSERQKVEGYLASKWGLTSSLPTIHPYRQFEPAQESYIPVAAYSNFLWTRFYNITSDPSINGPGSSGWGSLIGTAGAYNPINFQDSDARIGQSDYVGVISKGFMYSATTTVVTFRTNSDDGIVVFFNGVNVLQNWTYHGDTINNSASVTLPAGYTPIELRFFEWGGGFTCELYWSVGSTGTYVSDGTGVMFYNATSQS